MRTRALLTIPFVVLIAIPVAVFAVMGEWSRAGYFGVGLLLAVWALWQVGRNHRVREGASGQPSTEQRRPLQ